MTGWRHESLGGIDRRKPISFTFDGRSYSGFEGDTIASALLAAGVQIVGRSFKYHRPRGLYSAGSEEPNAIVDVEFAGTTNPNARATTERLIDGMRVNSVNASPDAASDRSSYIDWANRFLPAGFYYKTFMRPGWMRWEPMIRKMAGLGTIDTGYAPPAEVRQTLAICDVLVVGAGPAGLAAARASAKKGEVVYLIDEASEPGGSLRWCSGQIDGESWGAFAESTIALVRENGGKVLTNTTVWGAFDHSLLAAWERKSKAADCHWRIRAGRTIVAAGAMERPLWFQNNDLPGIMLAQAGLKYCNLYGSIAGKRIVIATANDTSYAVASDLVHAGAEVTLLDARTKDQSPPTNDAFEHLCGVQVTGARGKRSISGVEFGSKAEEADCLLVSGGFTPSVHLWCQAGGKLDWREDIDALVPRGEMSGMQVVGAANGTFDMHSALIEGHQAAGGKGKPPSAEKQETMPIMPMRPVPKNGKRQWIDLQNDVTLKDVALAEREGFVSVEHLKRYTTLGMATDQGKTSNFAGLAAMSAITGKSIPETGTTTYRPPYTPVPLLAIAGNRRGELFNPVKRLELERTYRDAGASFREYGGWLRPSVFGAGDEAEMAFEEAAIARKSAGLYDASPLGKLEVTGPAASKLLDFTNYVRMSTLPVNRCRYGLMLGENGVVHDDGVIMRLAEDRFIVSASSSHVESVRMILEEIRQDRFQSEGVVIQDVTSNWTTFSLTGPQSSQILSDAGIPDQNLGHMDVCEFKIDGIPVRLARVSFTGDKSFELSVPARESTDFDRRLIEQVENSGGRRIGLEAVMILRAEKGYILVGKDTDGITMPHDLGWNGPRNKRQDEFQGKRSLFTEEAKRSDRKQQVGLKVPVGGKMIPTGAHLVPVGENRRSLGFVTSSYNSPSLGRPIALALLENGQEKLGEEVKWFNDGETGTAEVTSACFVDPRGELLNG